MMATEFFNTLTIMHPCLAPQIFHTHCFQFLLGITVVPREIEDNGYEKFFGQASYIIFYMKMPNSYF